MPSQRIRFGVFEADLRNRELRKHGFRVKLQEKPFQILEVLLQRPGELVTREELAQHLWPGVYVSFERSLNTAVNALRRALSDSPRNSRYIETRAGLGYVFIAPVTADSGPAQRESTEKVVAVLPFHTREADLRAASEAIGDGVLSSLAHVPELRVIARSASSRFRDENADTCAVGRRLGAGKALTGTIARSGDAVRVEVELVDVNSGFRLWGQSYERAAGDVSAVAAAISAGVLNAVRVAPPGAHEDYLKGRYFCTRMTEDDVRRGVAHFEAALRQDPNYAPASAGLADALWCFALLGVRPGSEIYPRAKQLASAALDADPDLAEAHVSLARMRSSFGWDWAGSEAGFVKALELNPSCSAARQAYAGYLGARGRFDAALREIGEAQQLDPMAVPIKSDMARIAYMARDFKAAADRSWEALALDARFAPAQHTLGLAYEHMGMFEEAVVELGNAATCSNRHPATIAALAHVHARAGDRAESSRMVAELAAAADRRYVSPWWLSIAWTGTGEYERAFDSLRKAHEDRDVWLMWLGAEPRLDPLRSDARFTELVRAIGLDPAPASHATL